MKDFLTVPDRLKIIAFDADDTLWYNESFFKLTQEHVEGLLAEYTQTAHFRERLIAAERRNILHYGYGVKGFVLSIIETAIEVTDGAVPTSVIAQIIEAGRELLAHPVHLLDGVEEGLRVLAPEYRLMLITKGDLLHQEQKLARSGLGDVFDRVEIVSEKTPATYARIFGDVADASVMVGNSMKSDVLPALAAGAYGVYVPFEIIWEMEQADAPQSHPRFHEIQSLLALPDLIERIA